MGFGITRSVSRGGILYCFCQYWHLDKEAVFIFRKILGEIQNGSSSENYAPTFGYSCRPLWGGNNTNEMEICLNQYIKDCEAGAGKTPLSSQAKIIRK